MINRIFWGLLVGLIFTGMVGCGSKASVEEQKTDNVQASLDTSEKENPEPGKEKEEIQAEVPEEETTDSEIVDESADDGDTEVDDNVTQDSPDHPESRIRKDSGYEIEEKLEYSDEGYSATETETNDSFSDDYIYGYNNKGEEVYEKTIRYSADSPNGSVMQDDAFELGLMKKACWNDEFNNLNTDLSYLFEYDDNGKPVRINMAAWGITYKVPICCENDEYAIARLDVEQVDQYYNDWKPLWVDLKYEGNKIIAEYKLTDTVYDTETRSETTADFYFLKEIWEYDDAGMLSTNTLMCSSCGTFSRSALKQVPPIEINETPQNNDIYFVRKYTYDSNGNLKLEKTNRKMFDLCGDRVDQNITVTYSYN